MWEGITAKETTGDGTVIVLDDLEFLEGTDLRAFVLYRDSDARGLACEDSNESQQSEGISDNLATKRQCALQWSGGHLV